MNYLSLASVTMINPATGCLKVYKPHALILMILLQIILNTWRIIFCGRPYVKSNMSINIPMPMKIRV